MISIPLYDLAPCTIKNAESFCSALYRSLTSSMLSSVLIMMFVVDEVTVDEKKRIQR
ncbi:MAG: hypothetical protein ISQ60_02345 [Gammaproteobacteria bacterium]|nr:hypothetical protein [Gammaproteobacteria bacterium]MBL6898772.1 hypothetical protein [Gammaproteobacteria bacterium]